MNAPVEAPPAVGAAPIAAPPPPLRRNRDFALLWAGMAVSVLGSRISATAYPLLVLALTHSPADAGIVGFLATLPYLLVQLPAGAFIDRWNRKRTMIACDIGRGLALASLVIAFWLGSLTLPQIMVVSFIEGSLFVFYNLAEAAAVQAVVPRSQLPTALSRNEARNRAAALGGAPLGGALFGIGRALPFLADAASYVVSIATLLLIRTEFQAERDPAPVRSLWGEVREGLAWLWRQPFLRVTSLLVAGSNFMFQALVLFLIVIARDHGASTAVIGIMLAGMGVGGVLGSLASPWLQRHLRASTVVIGANWVWALLVPPIAFVSNPYALGAIVAAMAFIGPAWNVVVGAYQLAITPEQLLGRVASADTLVAYGAIPLGSLAAGLLLSSMNARTATLLLAAGMVALAAVATGSRSIRTAPNLDLEPPPMSA